MAMSPPNLSSTDGDVTAMGPEEMRNVLYDKLHNEGLLDSLKSQLRNYMISQLSGRGHRMHSQEPKPDLKGQPYKKALNSLVYRYLCQNGYDYTVGVFLPEAKMTKREVLSDDELYLMLNLPQPIREKSLSNSILHSAMEQLIKHSTEGRVDKSTETDVEPFGYLASKLTGVDNLYTHKVEPSSAAASAGASVEERLVFYQKQAEQTANQRAEENLSRWKDSELKLLLAAEKEKLSTELHQKKLQLEEEYRKRMAAVTARENSLMNSVKSEFETTQREVYQQRQLLLQQSEQLAHRESELREQKEQFSRLHRVNEEKLEKLEQIINKREVEVHHKELQLDNTLKQYLERCKMEEKIAYDSKYRELKAMEEKLKDKEASLEREKKNLLSSNERQELQELRQKYADVDGQIRRYTIEVASSEMKIMGLQERLSKMFDYEVIKESNISLKKDLQLTKERLESLQREHVIFQEKYEQLMLEGKDRAGLGEIMFVKTQMQKERDKAMDDKVILEHRLKDLEAKFTEQLRVNQKLVTEFEIQVDRQKNMNKEYGDLRKHMSLSHRPIADMGAYAGQSLNKKEFSFHKMDDCELLNDTETETSGATDDSVVTETRKRLDHLTKETDNLHSAFLQLTRSAAPYQSKPYHQESSNGNLTPRKALITSDSIAVSFSRIRQEMSSSDVNFFNPSSALNDEGFKEYKNISSNNSDFFGDVNASPNTARMQTEIVIKEQPVFRIDPKTLTPIDERFIDSQVSSEGPNPTYRTAGNEQLIGQTLPIYQTPTAEQTKGRSQFKPTTPDVVLPQSYNETEAPVIKDSESRPANDSDLPTVELHGSQEGKSSDVVLIREEKVSLDDLWNVKGPKENLIANKVTPVSDVKEGSKADQLPNSGGEVAAGTGSSISKYMSMFQQAEQKDRKDKDLSHQGSKQDSDDSSTSESLSFVKSEGAAPDEDFW